MHTNFKEIRLALKSEKKQNTIINIKGHNIGDGSLTIIGGPCAIKTKNELKTIAKEVKEAGCIGLRGGSFKPRTSPYSYQGLETEGFRIMHEVANEFGLIGISEVTDTKQIDDAVKYLDVLQVGARNMHNYELLKALGRTDKPILLKRGFSSTINEFLNSAEYILNEGNEKVILCERGIRTFEDATRNTLDLSSVAIIKEISHLPIIVDPSHASGIRSIVPKLSYASVAVGADGLLIESHYDPELSVSDKDQTIDCKTLKEINDKVKELHKIL